MNDARQKSKQVLDVIDLREDERDPFLPGFSSDALVPPSSPVREIPAPEKPAASESSSPAFQKQKTPENSKRPSRQNLEHRGSRNNKEGNHVKSQGRGELDRTSAGIALQRRGPDVGRIQAEKALEAPSSTKHAASRNSQHAEGGATLRFASSAPKKKTLLCQDQLTSKPKSTWSTDTDTAGDGLLDATSDQESEDRRPAERAKSQRQVLDERLAKIRKKELKAREKALQDRQQDLPAGPFNSTSSVSRGEVAEEAKQRTGLPSKECPQPPTQQQKSDPSRNAIEQSPISQQLQDPAEATPAPLRLPEPGHGLRQDDKGGSDCTSRSDVPKGGDMPQEQAFQQEHKKAPVRKKQGIGRKEIRESASSCYRKPDGQEQSMKAMDADTGASPFPGRAQSLFSAEGQPAAGTTNDVQLPAAKEDHQFRRVVPDVNAHTGPKQRRTPGAPMRIAPAPSKQDAPHKQRPHSPSVADADVSRTSPRASNPIQPRASEANSPITDPPAVPRPPPQQKKFIQPLPGQHETLSASTRQQRVQLR
ncbi:hypothetical protein BTJ68_08221 [Hortaea werneckii EXF-2000]|uniref:Uncharacterized protein n=1 Tax=Hortaea werneckii EXF-2000 TaxID=1157616 RepID=A0A1Z5TC82_HORWE|nr:hypothetical protein BTJ68_08221 [Hortaea werneckii EXF-2000]